MIPVARKVLTPKQYGAVAPPGAVWPINAADPSLYVVSDLYPAVQGEGVQAGRAMTILRLKGCPVGCIFCDTPETWAPVYVPSQTPDHVVQDGLRREMTAGQVEGAGQRSQPRSQGRLDALGTCQFWTTPGQVIPAVSLASQVACLPPRWVLITGGEPTWHNLHALTSALNSFGLSRALETSGVYPITGNWEWVCVSPKPAGRLQIRHESLVSPDELKWLVGRESDIVRLEEFLCTYGPLLRGTQVSVQPISCSVRATKLCLESLMQHPAWRISTQLHKYWNIK